MTVASSEALLNPRRRFLRDLVRRDPGVNFRELVRRSGLGLGVTRHHLSVLCAAGQLVERPHGASVRFFDATHPADSWVEVVLRRDPWLRLLLDWLHRNPNATQLDILDAMRRHGWPRSSAQHRLKRLVDAGLVHMRKARVCKIYTAVPTQSPGTIPSPRAHNRNQPRAGAGRVERGFVKRPRFSSRLRPSNSNPTVSGHPGRRTTKTLAADAP